ncbi:MAG: hypothetical protein AABZ74_04040 [Cyanobacteriota bacterium]
MSLRKISLSTLSLVVIAAMSACSTSTMTPSVASVNATSDLSFVSNIKSGTVDPVTNSIFVADVGNGKKGANINFTMTDASAFNTKGNGVRAGKFINIATVNVTLKQGVTTVFGPADVASTFTGTAPTGSKTFNFTNCAPGSYTVVINDVKDGASVNILSGGPVTSSATVVNADNQIPGGPATAAITLTNGTPASVDATVTSTDGTTTFGAISAS